MSRSAGIGLAIVVTLAVLTAWLAAPEQHDVAPERRASDDALASALAMGSLAADAELERRSAALEDAAQGAVDLAPTANPLARPFNGHATPYQPVRRVDRIDELRSRAFDQQFRKTPYDKAIDMLPMRTPPLRVVQWVTDLPPDKLATPAARERFYHLSQHARDAAVAAYYHSTPHTLYARVDRKTFFGMSVPAREAAVNAFYRDARPWFAKAGITDFVLIVTPLTPTTEHLPAYAVGQGDSATLTSLGRGQRPPV